jgi:hypothetical protein
MVQEDNGEDMETSKGRCVFTQDYMVSRMAVLRGVVKRRSQSRNVNGAEAGKSDFTPPIA